jgi:hypothetical protein
MSIELESRLLFDPVSLPTFDPPQALTPATNKKTANSATCFLITPSPPEAPTSDCTDNTLKM